MRGIAIVSGGLDSVTMLYDLISRDGDDVKVLSFDYGQRHAKELDQANGICADLGVEHFIIDMQSYGWVISGGSSSLLNANIDVPEGSYDDESMKATVVPNRNMAMLSMAAGYAITMEAQYIATAVHAGDHAIYPDCRPEFINSLTKTIKLANAGFIHADFQVRTPYINITKTDIAFIAKELGVPVERTWSCYKGGMFHCGRCGTCVERLEALHGANIDDSTVYLDNDFWREAIKNDEA
jgi:7-cyano-7-deazaguanine synthase